LYDKTGAHYKKGAGLYIFADGQEIAAGKALARVKGKLPPK